MLPDYEAALGDGRGFLFALRSASAAAKSRSGKFQKALGRACSQRTCGRLIIFAGCSRRKVSSSSSSPCRRIFAACSNDIL
jgi:hypothetical protein